MLEFNSSTPPAFVRRRGGRAKPPNSMLAMSSNDSEGERGTGERRTGGERGVGGVGAEAESQTVAVAREGAAWAVEVGVGE